MLNAFIVTPQVLDAKDGQYVWGQLQIYCTGTCELCRKLTTPQHKKIAY
jgi:hypothetical protein